MARPKFPSFRAAYTLIKEAASTRWPGPSRFASCLLGLCLLISIPLFFISLTTGMKLRHLGDTMQCYDLLKRMKVIALPVTMANYDATLEDNDWFSVDGGKGGPAILAATLLTPVTILIFLAINLWYHFRPRGLTNRRGMFFAISLIVEFILISTQDYWLDVDRHTLHPEYPLCWQRDESMKTLWDERKERKRLLMAGEILSGLGGLCIAAYLALALVAASENRKAGLRNSTRLHTLRHDNDGNNSNNGSQGNTLQPHNLPLSFIDTIAPTSLPSSVPSLQVPLTSLTRPKAPLPVTSLHQPPKPRGHSDEEAGVGLQVEHLPDGKRQQRECIRERAYLDAHREEHEDPFVDLTREDGWSPLRSTQSAQTVLNPKTGKWRKDSGR